MSSFESAYAIIDKVCQEYSIKRSDIILFREHKKIINSAIKKISKQLIISGFTYQQASNYLNTRKMSIYFHVNGRLPRKSVKNLENK